MDYDRLVAQHKDAVYRQMVRTCGNREDAEDVLVDALVTAFKKSDQLKDQGAFRQWVVSIGRRLCFHLRNRPEIRAIAGIDELANLPDAQVSALDLVAQSELSDCVHAAVDSLPEHYRGTYLACEIEGQTAPEFAESSGLSVPAVKSRLHRARLLVRQFLDDSLCAVPEGEPVGPRS